MKVLLKRSIIVGLILLLVCSGVATIYINSLSTNLYDETNEYLQDITIQTATAIKNKINENLTQLKSISLIIHQQDMSQKELLNYLDELAQRDGLKRFGIANKDGDVITSDNKTFNIKERQYFKDSLAGKAATSTSLIDYVDNKKIIVYSVPIYNQKEIVDGVLFGIFETDKLSDILSTAAYNDVGYSFIFNEQGQIIICSDDHLELSNIEDLNKIYLKDIDVKGDGIISFQDLDETDKYLSYANIKNNDWLVASVFPREIATKKIQNFIQSALATWLLIGVGGALLLTYFYFTQGKNKLRITQLAYEDAVTQHYNFNKFLEYCHSTKRLSRYVLINCDIKGFKWFNEIYGEDIANQLLRTIIQCMEEICHEDEFCCRESADHFALLLYKDTHEHLEQRLSDLTQCIREKFTGEYSTSQYFFHFGIYEMSEADNDIKNAFKKTQYVKNDMKQLSKDDVIFYQEDVFRKGLYNQQIEKEFDSSLKQEHFKVYIQPKVNLKTGEVSSGEALVRWHHPHQGLIAPAAFIPIYEKNGMLEKLDSYVLERTLKTLVYWKEKYDKEISISINVSRTYLFNEGFAEHLIELIESYPINPQQIEIEITETTAFNHQEELILILKEFKKHHLRIALDDFGSGYSSLNMLKDFPIDVVKIDQEFFRTNTFTQMRGHIIIEQVIELCHRLNIEVVAEGVETKEQKDFLVKHHCDYVQGYYYYKPMLIKDFEKHFIK